MGLIRRYVRIWSAAHKPTLKNQQVGSATTPTAPIPTPMSLGFVEAGQQDVLTLSPCLETLLQKPQIMAAGKRTGHTPGVAAHRFIKAFGLEIKIIQRNHLYGEVKCFRCGFNPLPQSGFPASGQGAESDQTAISAPFFSQAQEGQANRPQPIRVRLGMPVIKGDPVTPGLVLLSQPTLHITQLEMLKQPALVRD